MNNTVDRSRLNIPPRPLDLLPALLHPEGLKAKLHQSIVQIKDVMKPNLTATVIEIVCSSYSGRPPRGGT